MAHALVLIVLTWVYTSPCSIFSWFLCSACFPFCLQRLFLCFSFIFSRMSGKVGDGARGCLSTCRKFVNTCGERQTSAGTVKCAPNADLGHGCKGITSSHVSSLFFSFSCFQIFHVSNLCTTNVCSLSVNSTIWCHLHADVTFCSALAFFSKMVWTEVRPSWWTGYTPWGMREQRSQLLTAASSELGLAQRLRARNCFGVQTNSLWVWCRLTLQDDVALYCARRWSKRQENTGGFWRNSEASKVYDA